MFAEKWLLELIKLELTELAKWRKERGLNPGTLAVLRRRAIILDRLGAFIQESARDFIEEVITNLDAGKVCIVNTRNLAAIEEKAVLAVLTSKILNSRKRLLDRADGAALLSQKPILLIVLEEALGVLSQRVLRRSSNIFAELTREGRKYKVGLLTVVQIPHRLDQDVASNINTHGILGLAQDRSRRAVADNAMDDMAPLINEMKMLDIGEALISFPHKGEVPFPLPVKIFYYNELVAETDKSKKKTRRVTHRGLRR
jgi:DNA helicase HerA-like ATPase